METGLWDRDNYYKVKIKITNINYKKSKLTFKTKSIFLFNKKAESVFRIENTVEVRLQKRTKGSTSSPLFVLMKTVF